MVYKQPEHDQLSPSPTFPNKTKKEGRGGEHITHPTINQHRLPIHIPVRNQEQRQRAHVPVRAPHGVLPTHKRGLASGDLERDLGALLLRDVCMAEGVERGRGDAHGRYEQACCAIG